MWSIDLTAHYIWNGRDADGMFTHPTSLRQAAPIG
jgi:hypothetical protein